MANFDKRVVEAINRVLGLKKDEITDSIYKQVIEAPVFLVEYDGLIGSEDKLKSDARRRITGVYNDDVSALAEHLRDVFDKTENPMKDWEVVLSKYNDIKHIDVGVVSEGHSAKSELELPSPTSGDVKEEIKMAAKSVEEKKVAETGKDYEGFKENMTGGPGVDVGGTQDNPSSIADAEKTQDNAILAVGKVDINTQKDLSINVLESLKKNVQQIAEMWENVKANKLIATNKPVSARLVKTKVKGGHEGVYGKWTKELGDLNAYIDKARTDFAEKTGFTGRVVNVNDEYSVDGVTKKIFDMREAYQVMYPLLFNSENAKVNHPSNLERADAYRRALDELAKQGEAGAYNIVVSNPRYTVKAARFQGGSYQNKVLSLPEITTLCATAGGKIFYHTSAGMKNKDGMIRTNAPKFVITSTKRKPSDKDKVTQAPNTSGSAEDLRIVTITARFQGGKDITSSESNFEFVHVENKSEKKLKKFTMSMPALDGAGEVIANKFVSTQFKVDKPVNETSSTERAGQENKATTRTYRVALTCEFYALNDTPVAEFADLKLTFKQESSLGVKFEAYDAKQVSAEIDEAIKKLGDGTLDPDKLNGALGKLAQLAVHTAIGAVSVGNDAVAKIAHEGEAKTAADAKKVNAQAKEGIQE